MGFFSKLFNRNTLIPTARVDKNGRVVIRHMKAEELSGGSVANLPAPVETKPVPTREMVVKTMEFMADAVELDSYDYHTGIAPMERHMHKFSPKTLERMMALDKGDGGYHSWEIYCAFSEHEEVSEAYISDMVMLTNFTDELGGIIDTDESAYIIRGFAKYENLPPLGPDGTYPEERYDKCVSLFAVTRKFKRMIDEGTLDKNVLVTENELYKTLHRNPNATISLADREVADLLIGSSELDREKITDLLVERGALSAADLKGLLAGSAASALSDGAL